MKTLLLVLLSLSVLPVCPTCEGQPANRAQVRTFEIGATREEVVRSFGVPAKWWAPEPGKYLHTVIEYNAARGVWARVDDVYTRKTPRTLYEIHVLFNPDRRESRLHPKQRVTSLEFIADKPGTYSETLADFPEARSVCASGCRLSAIRNYNHSYSILVYPANPTETQLETGLLAATFFEPEGRHDDWCTVIKLDVEQRGSVFDPAPPDWETAKISEMDLSPVQLSTREPATIGRNWTGSGSPRDLGEWRPSMER